MTILLPPGMKGLNQALPKISFGFFHNIYFFYCTKESSPNFNTNINLLSANPRNGQTHSNNSSANCRRISWVCLTILWDYWVCLTIFVGLVLIGLNEFERINFYPPEMIIIPEMKKSIWFPDDFRGKKKLINLLKFA